MAFYLDQLNPLAGLRTTDVVHRIGMGQRGYYALLQWTYYFIEKRGPVTRAVKRRLLASLTGLDWNIKQADVGDDAEKKQIAEKQANELRVAYERVVNLRAALIFLAMADLRGFAHLEKIYRGGTPAVASGTGQRPSLQEGPWDVIELRIVEQWFWARNGFYGDWLYNGNALLTNTGEPIDPQHYVIHEVDDPADEIFLELETKRRVNDNDWDGFLADYGIPPMFIVQPPNVPREREAEYQASAEAAVSAARGSLPNGSSLETPSATGSGGAGVFSERLKYIDEQIVIAGTAGKLTVLSEAGSGTLAGSAQKEAFDEIAQAIANNVATVMQKQFDQPILARLFPNQPVLAYFEFAQIDVKDTGAVFDDAVKATTAGYKISAEEMSEKTGYDLEYVGPPQAQSAVVPNKSNLSRAVSPNDKAGAPRGGANDPAASTAPNDAKTNPENPVNPVQASVPIAPDPEQINSLVETAWHQIAEAEAADLVPLRRALESAIANPTPEKLQQLLESLPDVQMQLGDTAAQKRKDALGTALVQSLTS